MAIYTKVAAVTIAAAFLSVSCVASDTHGWTQIGSFAVSKNSGAATSPFWAGYIVKLAHTKNSSFYAELTVQFVMPSVVCTPYFSSVGVWVGFDGWKQSPDSVQQIGVEVNCTGGFASYQPFWELFPAPPVYIIPKYGTIIPGAHVELSISEDNFHKGDLYGLSIESWNPGPNNTHEYCLAECYEDSLYDNGTKHKTLEAIVEAPLSYPSKKPDPLADFGTIQFVNISASATGGVKGGGPQFLDLLGSGAYPVTMVGYKTHDLIASPGPLIPDNYYYPYWSNFTVGWAGYD